MSHAFPHSNGHLENGNKKQARLDISPAAAIDRFKQFLRIPTITVEGAAGPNYKCVEWLTALAVSIGVQSRVFEYVKGKPIILLTMEGKQPKLGSILLNSHYDVVPVMQEHWHYEPFAAIELPNGDIVARGSQDMKCVCTAYIEAVMRLLSDGIQLERTLHIAFNPDEETGGIEGVAKWIETDDFRSLNVVMALDEGLANINDMYTVFYGERAVWWTRIIATGPTGHGSRLIKETANEKLMRVVNRALTFRQTQVDLLEGKHDAGCSHATNKKLELGEVVTVNLTMLRSGVSNDAGKTFSINVIPMQAEAGFDIRIPPSVDLDEFENRLKEWTAEEGVSYQFYQKVTKHSATSIDPDKNVYWKIFTEVLGEMGRKVDPQIFPAGTDGRYLREIGIPVLGFSPIRLQPILLHDHDERLNKNTYLEGIDVYERLIPALCNNLDGK